MHSGFGEPTYDSPASVNTPHSYDLVHLAAAQLLDLGAGATGPAAPMPPAMDSSQPQTYIRHQLMQPLAVAEGNIPEVTAISPEQLFADDGIFLPGSTYLELHSALRNHIFDTARSTYTSRRSTPDNEACDAANVEVAELRPQLSTITAPVTGGPANSAESSSTTPTFIDLTKQEEYLLWKNWVDEIAPWVRYDLGLCACN